MAVVCEPLLPGRVTQFRPECQLQDFRRRELHPVRLERVPLHPGDELRFVVGVNLETAVAVEYVSRSHLESHRRKGLQDAGKLPARGRLARREPRDLARGARNDRH